MRAADYQQEVLSPSSKKLAFFLLQFINSILVGLLINYVLFDTLLHIDTFGFFLGLLLIGFMILIFSYIIGFVFIISYIHFFIYDPVVQNHYTSSQELICIASIPTFILLSILCLIILMQ